MVGMLTRFPLLQRLLAVPVVTDPERARAATVLHRLLLVGFSILVPLVVITPFVNPHPVAPWAVYGLLLAASGVSMWLLQHGRFRAGSLGIVCAVWLIAVADLVTSGGIRGPGTVLFFVAVLLAGVLLGTRPGLVFAVLSLAAGLVVTLAETRGMLVLEPVTPWRMWVGVNGGLAAIVMFLHVARRSETERRAAGERLQRSLSTTSEGFVLVARDGRIVDVNAAACDILQYSADQLRGLSVAALLPNEVDDEIPETIRRVLEQGTARFERQARRADGEIIHVEISATRMEFEAEPLMAVFFRDVTEQHHDRQALAESEARYRGLFDNSRDAIFVTTVDGTFVDANQAMLHLFGLRRTDLSGVNALELYARPDDRTRFRDLMARFGSVTDLSLLLRKRNGAVMDCLLTATVRKDAAGTLMGYEGVIRDVTEQKRTERALRDSERRLAEAERLAALGSWEWDMRDGTTSWSQEMFRLLGERSGDCQPSYESFRERIHPDDREHVDLLVRRAIESGTSFEFVRRIVRPDGTVRTLFGRGEVIHDESGQPIRMAGSGQDVTALHKAERALRESEERYRVLFENAPVGIGVADREGRLVAFNDAMLEPGGYTRGDGLLSNVADLYVDPADRAEILETFGQRGTVRQAETRFRRKDGGWYHAAVSLNPVVIAEQPCVLAIVQDITEAKRAQEELAKAQNLLLAAIEQTPAGILIADAPDGRIRLANSAALGIRGAAGVPLTDIPIERHPESWQVYHPDGSPFAAEDLPLSQAVLYGKTVRDVDALISHADGVKRWVLASAAPVRGPDGTVVAGVVVFPDITERKRAEAELRASEERFAKAFDLSPDAIIISIMEDGRIIDANAGLLRLSGYEREEVLGRSSVELGLWGDDPAARAEWVRMLRSEGSVRGLERTYRTRRGNVVAVVSAEVFELNGQPHVLTYATDITDRKRAEAELAASREQLREYAARLQAVREEERTAIAREIHDELGQALTGMKMDLAWLADRLPKTSKALRSRGQSLTELVDSTIIAVRDLSARLRPSVLDDLGLAAAVEWQVNDLARRTGLAVEFETNAETGDLDRDRATAMFRVLQEALTNVVRHASASRVAVMLKVQKDHLVLQVSDDGRGIREEQAEDPRSLGILGMRERTLAFGGSVEVQSRAQGGTVVTARIPFTGQTDA